MKTIAFCLSCMFGAIIAHHDTTLFMSSTLWIIVAAIGLLLLIVPALMVELPTCPLTNAFTSISAFIMCVGLFMTPVTFIISNQKVAGFLCALLVAFFALIARWLYTFSNESDARDAQESEDAGTTDLVDEHYPDDHPA